MPWGINIYQAISFDLQSERAQMLPSFIYYGVSSKEAVIVSKLGVPRFAVANVLSALKKVKPYLPISIENMSEVKGAIKEITANEYKIENVKGIFIKELVDQRLSL